MLDPEAVLRKVFKHCIKRMPVGSDKHHRLMEVDPSGTLIPPFARHLNGPQLIGRAAQTSGVLDRSFRLERASIGA